MSKYIYLVVGLIIGSLMTITLTVSATSVFKKLEATERPDYALVIHDNEVHLDSNIVAINGLSYLPVREIASILDLDVDFKDNRIILTSKQPLPEANKTTTNNTTNTTANQTESKTEITERESIAIDGKLHFKLIPQDMDRKIWGSFFDEMHLAKQHHGVDISLETKLHYTFTRDKKTATLIVPNKQENGIFVWKLGEDDINIMVVSDQVFFKLEDMRKAGYIN